MTYFIEKSEFIKKAEIQKNIYRGFLSMMEGVEKIIRSFDGKVINVRIEREIKSFLESNFPKYRFCIAGNNTFTFKSFERGFITSEMIFEAKIKEGKRLDSAGTLENKEDIKNRFNSKIKEIDDYLENFDNYRQMTEKLMKEIETYEKNVPFILRPYINVSEKRI